MNTALWIIAAILAAASIAAGAMKLARSRQELAAAGMDWADDLSDGQVKAIGLVEVLGGIGVVLPALVDIAPVLVPLAATGLAVTMAGAAVFHIRRNDPLA
ncbi:MAG: DoxX family protein, partial [Microthrixaceae bacterium]|nr:DoxX family protein [Microthrixaceae bacterium]